MFGILVSAWKPRGDGDEYLPLRLACLNSQHFRNPISGCLQAAGLIWPRGKSRCSVSAASPPPKQKQTPAAGLGHCCHGCLFSLSFQGAPRPSAAGLLRAGPEKGARQTGPRKGQAGPAKKEMGWGRHSCKWLFFTASTLGHSSCPLAVCSQVCLVVVVPRREGIRIPPRELELLIGGQDVQLHFNFR